MGEHYHPGGPAIKVSMLFFGPLAERMGQRFIDNIDNLLKEWKPQPRFTVTKIDDNTILNNYNSNPISLSPEFLKEIQSI